MRSHVYSVSLTNQWPLFFQGRICQLRSSLPVFFFYLNVQCCSTGCVSIIHVDTCTVSTFPYSSVVFLMWRHVKLIFVCFRICILYFDILIHDMLLDFNGGWGKNAQNTPCIVFSALNKICCILLWTLISLAFALLHHLDWPVCTCIAYVKFISIWDPKVDCSQAPRRSWFQSGPPWVLF